MGTLEELVLRNRSYRRFDETHRVERATLEELVNLARRTASAANRQPLKYVLATKPEECEAIFGCLAWAGYLKDWPGPAPGERPGAYIVLLVDEQISTEWWCDDGIAAQTILLGAVERGLGGCMIGAIRQPELREVLQLAPHLHVRLVLALGRPVETVVLEELPPDGDIRYWRDAAGVHHVPKRSLDEVIVRA